MAKPRWLEIITEGYMKDAKTKELLAELSINNNNEQGFSLMDGLIRHKWKIWLGSHVEAQGCAPGLPQQWVRGTLRCFAYISQNQTGLLLASPQTRCVQICLAMFHMPTSQE
jgi:hypothetical protein